ncbi:MAG: AAA family ATPase [Planctomycetes bacterium]|nr:AAA family ATPase [Planctomycetota bacterium]
MPRPAQHESHGEDVGLEFFVKVPLLPPRRIFRILEEKGYRGQDAARRTMSLVAYRHVKRLKQIYIDGIPREKLPAKANVLLMGPTGCGKTFIVELIFQHILKLPTVIVDMTGFSETGYIGDDTKTILTRLLLAAEGNPLIASSGVVCMDEFDKLASTQNCARFDGQGTTKDVSGFGVQRELLRMLETSEVEVPTDFNNSIYSTKRRLFTGDVTFIACGAFSGFKWTALDRTSGPKLGYRANFDASEADRIAIQLQEAEVANVETFHSYGFIPELIGRFSRIVPLSPLDRRTLKQILVDNVVQQFRYEFAEEGLDLEVGEDVLDWVVDKALERQTGARGLNSVLTQILEDAAFENFCFRKGRVTVRVEKGEAKAVFREG